MTYRYSNLKFVLFKIFSKKTDILVINRSSDCVRCVPDRNVWISIINFTNVMLILLIVVICPICVCASRVIIYVFDIIGVGRTGGGGGVCGILPGNPGG